MASDTAVPVLGLGIDLIELPTFQALYGEDSEMLERCFRASELRLRENGPNGVVRLAARMAVKEAVFKALQADASVSHLDIEVIGDGGPPSIRLHGPALELARARGVGTILVSLSHASVSVAAVAVALGGPDRLQEPPGTPG